MSTFAKTAGLTEARGASLTAASGICSTCIHKAGCLYFAAARSPVWYCDEFHDSEPGGAKERRDETAEIAARILIGKEPDFADAKMGVCSNCDSHGNCTFEKPEGTMYCEEYVL